MSNGIGARWALEAVWNPNPMLVSFPWEPLCWPWSPHWVDFKCLAKVGWCVGSGAHHPLPLWSLQMCKPGPGAAGWRKHFLSGAGRHLLQGVKAVWLLQLHGCCQFGSPYRSLVPQKLLVKPITVVNFLCKKNYHSERMCEKHLTPT